MKALKKALALLLSVIMVFSTVSLIAVAEFGDGNRNTFSVTSWFVRYDEETGEWVKANGKAARGDKVRVQLTIKTDFAAGTMNLLWEFTKKNLAFDGDAHTAYSATAFNPIYNTEPGTITGDYGYTGLITAVTNDYKTGNTFVDRLVQYNHITEDFVKDHGFIVNPIKTFTNGTATICQILPGTDWMWEYAFTVADDATGEGKFFLEPSTVISSEAKTAYFNIYRAAQDGVTTTARAQGMHTFVPSFTTSHEALTFDNKIKFTTTEGTVSGTSEYTGYIGDKITTAEGFAIPTAAAAGKSFLGWSLDGSTVLTDDEIKALEFDYDVVTLSAVFEAANATYKQNVYTMDTNGNYGEAVSTDIGASTGDMVNASAYNVPAGFTLDTEKSTKGDVTVDANGTSALDIYLKRNQYNVTFGTNAAVPTYYEADYAAPAGPAKDGYTFVGWKNGDVVLTEGQTAKMGLADVTYTADYAAAENKVTVVINYVDQVTGEAKKVNMEVPTTTGYTVVLVDKLPDEPAEKTDYVLIKNLTDIEHYEYTAAGSETSVAVADNGTAVINVNYVPVKYTAAFGTTASYTEDYYTEIKAPDGPKKDGETFDKWVATNSKGNTISLAKDDTLYISENLTFTATYVPTDYTVTYTFAGEAPIAAPDQITNAHMNDDVDLELDKMVADGWTFKGWTVSGAVAGDTEGTYKVGTQNVTLTGSWVENTYTVNYWLDDSETEIYDSQELFFGDSVYLPELPADDQLLNPGFYAIGWDNDEIEEINEDTEDSFTMVEPGVYEYNLHVMEEAYDYEVTFVFVNVADDYSDYLEGYTVGVPYGYKLGEDPDEIPDTTIVEGYDFVEWKIGPSAVTFPYEITEETQVRGYFNVQQYDAIFDANGGAWLNGDTVRTIPTDYGTDITAPLENPVREGYTLDPDMPWGEDLGTMFTEDQTFEAQWIANEYTVTFTDGTKTVTVTVPYGDGTDRTPLAVPGEFSNIATENYKPGYVFQGWSADGGATVVEDITTVYVPANNTTSYEAIFAPIQGGVTYKVNRYFMNTDGNYDGVEADTVTLSGTAGEPVTYNATITGFTLDTSAGKLTDTVDGNGSTVLEAYYIRNKVTVDVNGETEDYYHGEKIELPTAPDKEGEKFDHWEDDNGNTVTDPYVVPNEEDQKVELTPVYTKKTFNATFIIGAEGQSATYATTSALYGDPVVAPALPGEADLPTGYTFVGWAKTEGATEALTDLGATPANDTTFYAVLAGKTDIKYNIEKYFMETDGVTYTLDPVKSESNYDGEAGKELTITPDTYEGFTFNAGHKDNVLKAVIKGNGTTTFKVYYDRNKVNVTINGKEEQKFYGEQITEPTAPKADEGYEFDQWVDEDENPVKFPVTVGTEDIVLNPTFKPGTAGYTVEIYEMDLNGNYGAPIETITDKTGTTESEVTYTPEYKEGFTAQPVSGVVIGNGSLTLKVYYERNKHFVTYYAKNDQGVATEIDKVEVYYGAEVTGSNKLVVAAGYELLGWSTNPNAETPDADLGTMGDGDTALYAVVKANEGTPFFIDIFVQSADGEGYEKSTVNMTGTTGNVIVYEPEAKTGFTINAESSTYDNYVTIGGDGKTRVSVFYDRITYQVTIDGVTDDYLYGETIEKDDPEVEDGYTFDGWKDDEGNTVTFPMNVPVVDEDGLVITPVITPKNYKVIFNINGKEYASGSYPYKSDIVVPAAPGEDYLPAGFDFAGWSKDGKTVLEDLGKVALGDDANIFEAVLVSLETTYTVKKVFPNLDGGWDAAVTETRKAMTGDTVALKAADEYVEGFTVSKITPESDVVRGDGKTEIYVYYTRNTVNVTINGEEKEYFFGEKIEAPADPSKDGYDYKGWVDGEGNPVEFPITVPNKDLVIEPVFEAQTKSLSFEVDGVTVEGYPTTAKVDSAIEKPATDPKKDGYNFVGWVIKGTNTTFTGKMPTTDTIYEAKWTADTNTMYTINIYMMDTNGKYTLSTSTISYGVTGTLAEIVPNDALLEGFTHDAALSELSKTIEGDKSTVLKIYYARDQYTVTWNVDGLETKTEVYYGAAIVAPETPVKDGYTFKAWDPAIPATMPAENLTFTATWNEASYKVTYVVNGVKYEETYKYGDTVTVREEPSVEGMTFEGWYDGNDKYEVGSTFTIDKDLIIVANFSKAVYKATFVNEDGSVFEIIMVEAGDEIPVPTTVPVKKNHKFLGWKLTYDKMPAKNITVEPDFERIPPRLVEEPGSTTVIDREKFIITGLQEILNENILADYLEVEGDGFYKIVPVQTRYYGTGTKVELYDNLDTSAPIETYVIVVYGDVNGDSLIEDTDGGLIGDEGFALAWSTEEYYDRDSKTWIKNENYDPYKTMAADLNGDGNIDALDRGIHGDVVLTISVIDQVTGRAV